MAEVFHQIDNITVARRIAAPSGDWPRPECHLAALFPGAILTVAFTLFFGSENLARRWR